jgi:hypothetical protein
MRTFNRLTFTVEATTTGGPRGALIVTPFVDDVSLIGLVSAFEQSRGYSPAGGCRALHLVASLPTGRVSWLRTDELRSVAHRAQSLASRC